MREALYIGWGGGTGDARNHDPHAAEYWDDLDGSFWTDLYGDVPDPHEVLYTSGVCG